MRGRGERGRLRHLQQRKEKTKRSCTSLGDQPVKRLINVVFTGRKPQKLYCTRSALALLRRRSAARASVPSRTLAMPAAVPRVGECCPLMAEKYHPKSRDHHARRVMMMITRSGWFARNTSANPFTWQQENTPKQARRTVALQRCQRNDARSRKQRCLIIQDVSIMTLNSSREGIMKFSSNMHIALIISTGFISRMT